MVCQLAVPIKCAGACLIGIPTVKAITGAGRIGRLHINSKLPFFHRNRTGIGCAAAGASVVLIKTNPEGFCNDGIQLNVAVCNRHGSNGCRTILRGGPAFEGLRIQFGDDRNICRIHNLGSFARFEQDLFHLNNLAVLAVERNIISRNDLGGYFDRFRLSRFYRAADHDLLIRFIKPAVERRVGRERRETGIHDRVAVPEDLGVEQRFTDIEVVRNGDAGFGIFIFFLNQNIHGERARGEGNLAAYRLVGADAVAVRDSVVIDLDRSGIAAVQTNSDLNALLKRPLCAFAVYDLDIVGSKHLLAFCSRGTVGRGRHLRTDPGVYGRNGHISADRQITGNRNFTGCKYLISRFFGFRFRDGLFRINRLCGLDGLFRVYRIFRIRRLDGLFRISRFCGLDGLFRIHRIFRIRRFCRILRIFRIRRLCRIFTDFIDHCFFA